MIRAGKGSVDVANQLSSAKKRSQMGGKVLVLTQEAINKLISARLAADVMGVPTVVIARTDANAATLLQAAYDERDAKFLPGEESADGFHLVKSGSDQANDRCTNTI